MKLIKPKRLKRGDTIGIITPSGNLVNTHLKDYFAYLEKAKKYFESIGLKIVYGKNIYKVDKYRASAGTAKERADDLNSMFKSKKINAIWCYQGGATAIELLDKIDYQSIRKNPKIFLGKSDVDLLLLAIYKKTGLITFHAPDFKIGRNKDMDFEYSKKWFKLRLFEGKKEIKPDSKWKILRSGNARGKIIGCNHSTIIKLSGTEYLPNFDNSILFLESYSPSIREVRDRLMQLDLMGVFNKTKAIVIGYIFGYQNKKKFKENPKLDLKGRKVKYEDLVMDAVKNYNMPVIKINEFGHYYSNCFLPIGVRAELKLGKLNIIENFIK